MKRTDKRVDPIPPQKPRVDFYPSVPSCQIPALSFILESVFGQIETGTFVEVGANDGISHSNTWGLAERGWRGLYLEPDPELARTCARNHAGHANVNTVNLAAGPPEVRTGTLHRNGVLSTLSTPMHGVYVTLSWGKPNVSGETVTVNVDTLDNILSEHSIRPGFELLVVDTEGYEDQVLAGFAISVWRPQVIIIELADLHPELELRHEVDYALYLALLSAGYVTVYKDLINTILVDSYVYQHEWRPRPLPQS